MRESKETVMAVTAVGEGLTYDGASVQPGLLAPAANCGQGAVILVGVRGAAAASALGTLAVGVLMAHFEGDRLLRADAMQSVWHCKSASKTPTGFEANSICKLHTRNMSAILAPDLNALPFGRKTMIARVFLLLSSLVLGSLSCSHDAFAQAPNPLAGAWTLVSYDTVAADGARRPLLGAKPIGTLIFDSSGHYVMVLLDSQRPKEWGATREQVTAEQYKSAASGMVAQFGTWTVTANAVTNKIDGALNPNNAGAQSRLEFEVSGNELRLLAAASKLTGGRTEQVFRRAK